MPTPFSLWLLDHSKPQQRFPLSLRGSHQTEAKQVLQSSLTFSGEKTVLFSAEDIGGIDAYRKVHFGSLPDVQGSPYLPWVFMQANYALLVSKVTPMNGRNLFTEESFRLEGLDRLTDALLREFPDLVPEQIYTAVYNQEHHVLTFG